MDKKLSQNLIVAANTIAFGGAAIFGGIGIFSAIANFTKGSWYIYGFGIESLIGSVATSFFLAVLALMLGLLAKFTIKKITNSDLLKKSYGTLSIVAGLIGVVAVAVAISIAIYALIVIGSNADQKELWLNGFLSAVIVATVTFVVAYAAKKISAGKITILPLATNIVLGVASLSLLLMIISTIVNTYGKSKTPSLDDYDSLYDLFY